MTQQSTKTYKQMKTLSTFTNLSSCFPHLLGPDYFPDQPQLKNS